MANPRGNVATLKKYQPKWQSGTTQTIRVPVALTEQILDYARELDQGKAEHSSISSETLSQVIKKLESVLDTPRNNFSREKKGLLKSAIDELKSLVTSDSRQK